MSFDIGDNEQNWFKTEPAKPIAKGIHKTKETTNEMVYRCCRCPRRSPFPGWCTHILPWMLLTHGSQPPLSPKNWPRSWNVHQSFISPSQRFSWYETKRLPLILNSSPHQLQSWIKSMASFSSRVPSGARIKLVSHSLLTFFPFPMSLRLRTLLVNHLSKNPHLRLFVWGR